MFPAIAAVAPYLSFLFLCTAAAPASSHELSPRDSACAVAASPPQSAICGQRGKYTPNKRGAKFLTRQFTDLPTCAQYCSDASVYQRGQFCSAFMYNTDINQCVLFQRQTRFINFTQDDSSSTYLYYYGCYDCPLQCNTPPEQNLLYNPSFNLSKNRLGPWVLIAGLPKYTPLDDGGNAITYTLNDRKTASMELLQYRYLCDDVEYLLSFDMNLDVTVSGNSDASPTDFVLPISWSFGDCSYTGYMNADNTPLGTWRTFGCSLRRKQSTNSEFLFRAYTNQEHPDYIYQLSFANMKLTRLSDDPINTKGPSVLSNGDFEDATPDPWMPTSDFYDYYSYYSTDPPDQCVVNGNKIPLYSLVKPGLPPSSGAPASAQAFRFCGVTPAVPMNEYDPQNIVYFEFAQLIENHGSKDKLYLLSATYRTIPEGTPAYITLEGLGPDGKARNDRLRFNPVQTQDGGQWTLQQLFHGASVGSGIASLTLQWQTESEAPDYYTQAPPAQLQVIVDNISIREVDE